MRKPIVLIIVLILFSILQLHAAFESKVIYNQGIEAFKASNFSSAELLFRKTLENNDDYRDRAWFYLARTIYQQGKYKAAIFEFNSFLTKCRTENLRIESRFWMAESYFFLNDILKSIEEYNRYLEKSDDPALIMIARDRIATIYFNQQRYDEAVIEWEQSIKNSADMDQNARIVIKIGRALFKNGQYEKSLERLLPLLSARINSHNKAEIRLLVGRLYQLLDDHKKAMTSLNAIPKELTEMYPFYDVYYFRALSYLSLERTASARSELELFQVIGKKSEFYTQGMFELGRITLSSGKTESGIEILHDIWDTSSDSEMSLKSAILIAEYYTDNNPDKAINYIKKYIKYPDDEYNKKILLMLVRAYIKTEQYDNAESMINMFSEKYPYDQNIDEINFSKGIVLLQRGELDNALSIFNNIKKDNPFSKFINDTDYYMALVSYKKGKTNEAIDYLIQYTAKKGVNKLFDAHYLLADIYISSGELKKAEREVVILVNTYTKYTNVDRVLFTLAKNLYENKIKSAQNYFNLLQNRYPDSVYSSMINLLYGNSFFSSGNYEKAILNYEKYLNSNAAESRGLAFYNLLQSNYRLKKYNRVIEIISSIKIPVLDEEQWKEIPLLQARSYYNLKNYEQVYNLLKWEKFLHYSNEDIRMLVDSTIRAGDIRTATGMIEQLSDKESLHREMQLLLAVYYEQNSNYDEAKNIYNLILVSGAEEPVKEKARISLSEIFIKEGNYELSINLLNQVELKENIAERDCLIIINQFYSGKEKRGAEITDSRLKFILDNRFTEKVLLLNVVYHYKQKNLSSFNSYVKYLRVYKDNLDYINYLSGKLSFEIGAYKQSYLSFYKLVNSNNEYSTETNYYLGKLTLLYYNNKSSSLKYYQKVLTEKNQKNEFVQKSKIELAIIYNELRNHKASIQLLNELIAENDKGRFRNQAENLLEIIPVK
ncbi:MAG TPA: tetratricopeptide repeat protein [Spirochaetota bacterium]|nr:tetratricopeptide repeat protein [Spirochaetota bacterium]